MHNYFVVTAIGLLAQAFFSARMLYQWIASERSKKVLSPSWFWILSIAGAYTLFFYGWLRQDFSIILGPFVSYYVYLWNLKLKGVWPKVPRWLKVILLLTPPAVVAALLRDPATFVDTFFRNEKIPIPLLIWGSGGQIILTFRFVYQWLCSLKSKESQLTPGFWFISMLGSGLVLSYGIVRLDVVLILGQAFGFVTYIRNLMIGHNERKRPRAAQSAQSAQAAQDATPS